MIHQIDLARRFSISAAVVVVAFCLAAGAQSSGLLTQERPERIIPMPEVEKPRQICVKDGKAYIADAKDILVYALDDGRLVRRIGGVGQGPGEFPMGPLSMTALADRLMVSSLRSYVFFSYEGRYIEQFSSPEGLTYLPFLPVGDHYLGFVSERLPNGALGPPYGCLFDRERKSPRRFCGPLPAGPSPPPPPGAPAPTMKEDRIMINDYADCAAFEGKIFVADSRKGFLISVYDRGGVPLYEIRHNIEKTKVSQEFKDAVIKEEKASKAWPIFDAAYNMVFPEFFPVLIGFKIADGRIYAVTSNQEADGYEVLTMDLKGRILEKSFRFPLKPPFFRLYFMKIAYDIENGRIHWFAYNDQKEQYELHIR